MDEQNIYRRTKIKNIQRLKKLGWIQIGNSLTWIDPETKLITAESEAFLKLNTLIPPQNLKD
jgi:hypothetical protein